ncbi:MAG: DUF58 domain-containing protein [Spirochaetaceae bacterium]|nr:DUF58 domain-containing protein [Spirochaetaceae bacterium]
MNKAELLSRIRAFQISAGDLAEDLLAGDFASVFRGQGIEFDEVRHYESGDDVRAIDWNVTARFGEPYVKLYREEREFSLCIVLDLSRSMRTGGRGESLSRFEQGLLAAALLALSAERTGQQVGAVFFDAALGRVWRPRKGRPHIMAILNSALEEEPLSGGSALGGALAGTARLLGSQHFRRGGPRCLVAVISDFMALHWERELGDLAAFHDVIALRISGPLDTEAPPAGISLLDNETGLALHPSSSPLFRSRWAAGHEERSRLWLSACRRAGAFPLGLSTADDAAAVLARFFRSRGKRRRAAR